MFGRGWGLWDQGFGTLSKNWPTPPPPTPPLCNLNTQKPVVDWCQDAREIFWRNWTGEIKSEIKSSPWRSTSTPHGHQGRQVRWVCCEDLAAPSLMEKEFLSWPSSNNVGSFAPHSLAINLLLFCRCLVCLTTPLSPPSNCSTGRSLDIELFFFSFAYALLKAEGCLGMLRASNPQQSSTTLYKPHQS